MFGYNNILRKKTSQNIVIHSLYDEKNIAMLRKKPTEPEQQKSFENRCFCVEGKPRGPFE